jgi:hypothetical protein
MVIYDIISRPDLVLLISRAKKYLGHKELNYYLKKLAKQKGRDWLIHYNHFKYLL